VNSSQGKYKVNALKIRTRIQSVAAILLLQVNMAFAVEPAQAQATPADSQTTQPAPEAPAPTTGSPASGPTLAQTMQQQQQTSFAPQHVFYVPLPHSRNPLAPYRPSTVPQLDLSNSPRLQNLIRDGKLYISLPDAIALAIEDNLDLASFRYNLPTALTDLARTKAGYSALGVNTSVTSPQGASSGSGLAGGGGVSSSGAGAAGAGGLVTSTLGEGTFVNPFDPILTVKGYVDHTKTQELNTVLVGVPLLENNTIGYTTQFTE